MQQIVGPPPRSSAGSLCKQVRASKTRPREQHPAQSALRIEVHRALFTPVLALVPQYPTSAPQRVERVRDLERDRFTVRTTCSC